MNANVASETLIAIFAYGALVMWINYVHHIFIHIAVNWWMGAQILCI